MARRRFVKVTEAAEILGISRTTAYAEAKRYRDSGGAEGLAVVAVGGTLRVSISWLETMAGGPIDPDETSAATTVPVTSLEARRATRAPSTSEREPEPREPAARSPQEPIQRSLPFTG